MNIRILLYFIFFSLAAIHVQAQAEEEEMATLNNESNRKHIIKTNLLSILTGSASLNYENILNNHSGIQAGAYYGKSNLLGGIERLSITTEYRRYFSKEENPLVGMYLAPYLKYQQLTHSEEDMNEQLTAEASITTVGLGVLIGRQWIAKKGFTVDMYAGAGYNPHVKLQSVKQVDNDYPYSFSERRWQTDIRLGLVAGFAF
jgi:hypothetical protein